MTNAVNKLGVLVVGCGYWGINYVRVFSELPGVELVAVCDQRPERLQEVGRRFQGVAKMTDLDEALQMEGVDAAVICTGATTHYPVACRCLAAGKHVLIEKPMATRVEDAQALIDLADEKGLTLMVGHTFLYNAAVRKVKEYIDRSEMGQIYYLYASRTNLGPIRQDVNALWDLAPHDISIFNYLLGQTPQWVSAVGSNLLNNSRADVGFVSMGYEDNIVGNVHVSWADPHKVRQLVVVGSNRRIVFDDLQLTERVRVFEKGVTPAKPEADSYGEYHLLIHDGDVISPRIEVSEPLKNQCKHFLECVAEGKQPLTDGRAGLEVVQVMGAIDRSIEKHGAPVSVQTKALPVQNANGGTPVETVMEKQQ